MAIGRISGAMLYTNLERQGLPLSITGGKLGVQTTNPQYDLDVNGNVQLANIVIYNNSISSTTGKVNLGDIGSVQITGGSANYILYTDGAGNLNFGNLDTLSGLEGFTADYIALGSNAVGSFSNALTFTTTTKVTDAIASLNSLLGSITNSTGTVIHVNTVTVGNVDVYANLSSTSANVATLQSNAAVQATWLGNLDANLGTATTNITTLFSNAATQATSIDYINANVTAANTAIATLQTQVYSNANVASYLPIYSGNISANYFIGNVVTNTITSQTGTVVTVGGTGALKLPIGTTAQQPTGTNGLIRFNSDSSTVEYWSGSLWTPLSNTVTDQVITGDGVNSVYTLDQVATNIGVLVSINGTLQQPGAAYTVSGNQITFTEIPLTTDVIDIRFLGGVVSLNNTLSDDLTVSGNLTISGILTAPQVTKASNATGTVGQICWDSNYIYVCTATNTWKRSPLTGGY
jgi:hypothetical protein